MPWTYAVSRSTAKGKKQNDDLVDKLGALSVAKKAETPKKNRVSSSSKPKVPAAFTEQVPAPPGEDAPTILLETLADLYLYDQTTGLFMAQEKKVEAKVLEAGRFLCE